MALLQLRLMKGHLLLMLLIPALLFGFGGSTHLILCILLSFYWLLGCGLMLFMKYVVYRQVAVLLKISPLENVRARRLPGPHFAQPGCITPTTFTRMPFTIIRYAIAAKTISDANSDQEGSVVSTKPLYIGLNAAPSQPSDWTEK